MGVPFWRMSSKLMIRLFSFTDKYYFSYELDYELLKPTRNFRILSKSTRLSCDATALETYEGRFRMTFDEQNDKIFITIRCLICNAVYKTSLANKYMEDDWITQDKLSETKWDAFVDDLAVREATHED